MAKAQNLEERDIQQGNLLAVLVIQETIYNTSEVKTFLIDLFSNCIKYHLTGFTNIISVNAGLTRRTIKKVSILVHLVVTVWHHNYKRSLPDTNGQQKIGNSCFISHLNG